MPSTVITVASGTGITSSISTIVNLRETRKVHLIWMCRDADLVEFYMKNLQFDDDAWSFIFYTGKRALVLGEKPTNPRVKVCFGRPDLEELILGLIDETANNTLVKFRGSLALKTLLKRAHEAEAKIYDRSRTARFCDAFERGMTSYRAGEMFSMALDFTDAVDGKLSESASKKGFFEMVKTVCGSIDGLSDDELSAVFNAVDTDDNGTLDSIELEQIVVSLRNMANAENVPAKNVLATRTSEATERSLRRSFGFKQRASVDETEAHLKELVDSWQIMYCGGAAPVVKTLTQVHEKYSIPLKIESFAW